MGVHEQGSYPFLSDEIRLVEKALYEEKPVLGVCLGSQLLASALGADVRKGERKEIGWRRIRLAEAASEDSLLKGVQNSFMAFHWHGDVFKLPKGSVALASSVWTEYQAFRYGDKAYGFLFHMEVTEEIIRAMVAAFRDEIEEAQVDGNGIIRDIGQHLLTLQREIGKPAFERCFSHSFRQRIIGIP